MSHPWTQRQRVGGPDTEDNDRVRHPQTENDHNQKDTDETASWKRRDRPWFALLEFALSVEVPRGIADERDSADRTVTPTGNKTKMNGFVEISTLLIHSAPKQKSNEWMHLSPFYTRIHGEWLRYAKSTSQFHWRFLLVRDVRGFQVNPLCRHDITRSDWQIGNKDILVEPLVKVFYFAVFLVITKNNVINYEFHCHHNNWTENRVNFRMSLFPLHSPTMNSESVLCGDVLKSHFSRTVSRPLSVSGNCWAIYCN